MTETQSSAAWLELACTPGIGAVLAHRLVAYFGSPAAALAASDDELARAGLPQRPREQLRANDRSASNAARAWLQAPDHHFLVHTEPRFPNAILELEGAPPWLYASGDLDLLNRPAIAIVGSRNPTAGGRELAHDFARTLANAGLVVVSGLARGIDAAAHEGALAAGGMTIAVCGTGLDQVYPAVNATLAERIVANGLLLSEFALGNEASARQLSAPQSRHCRFDTGHTRG
ncbi:DNA-processing protein DprA [Salinisphaera orenii]|uniref:DNA-processing protein DprA n=1 Tax=Salinisphaera orenii TaxID=856731 RepID=UPI0019550626